MDLPVYEMVINPDEISDVEVSFVALVDKPAIERNFLTFKDEGFGGPGSGPQPGGGSGGGDDDSEGEADTAKILAKPRTERSEQDIKHLLKRKKKTEVKELVQENRGWIKNNPDKDGTPEHKVRVREINVGDKILKGYYSAVLQFAINADKRIISGPAMVAESLIYRNDEQGEYNVFFSKETISQIALKFFKKDYHKNLNLFHDPTLSLEGVTIFESFVSDASRGVHPMKGFEDLPDGSWFISAKIENDEVWNKIKSGEVKGFSVEGIFSYVKKAQNGTIKHGSHLIESDFMADLKQTIKELKEKFLGGPVDTKPAVPANPVQTLSTDYKLADGTAVSIDKLEVGGVVLVNGAPAGAGEYELEDGTKCIVGDGGVIMAVAPKAVDPNAAPVLQSADYTAQFAEIKNKFTAYETKFTEQTGIITGLQGLLNSQKETITGLFTIIEQIAQSSSADPITENKNSFKTQKVETKEERLNTLAENLKKLKSK